MIASLRTYGAIVLGLAALVQSGCVAAVAGVAGAGAVAGYMYYNGLLYRDYRAVWVDSLTAVRTALLNQKFPIDSGKRRSRCRDGVIQNKRRSYHPRSPGRHPRTSSWRWHAHAHRRSRRLER